MKSHHIIIAAFAAVVYNFLTIQTGDPDVYEAGFIISFVLMVVFTVASELLRPKPEIEEARPKGLRDFNFPTATEGRVVPIVWGKVMMESPNIVWYGGVSTSPIKNKIKSGPFGINTKYVTVGFRYHVGMQVALCRGTIDSVHSFYVGDEQMWIGDQTTTIDVDEEEVYGGDKNGNGGIQMKLDVYTGTDTQAASDFLANYQDAGVGSDRVPRYTGTCYIVARDLDAAAVDGLGAYIGNSTTMRPWKFEISRFPALFSGQGGVQNKINGVDCNPINVLYEILTDTDWGLGFAPADLDVGPGSSFLSASDICVNEGLGFSMVLAKVLEAKDMIIELERHIDGVLFLDQRTGIWKIKMARADYDVNTVPHLTSDNVIAVKDFSQGTWGETINQVQVKFNHRDNLYKETYAASNDSANYITQGGGSIGTGSNVSAKVVFPGVKSPSTAANIAWRELRSRSFPLARATFEVTREFWELNIGDVVTWTDARYGYDKLAMRIMKIDYGQLDKNKIVLSCVQDIFRYVAPSFAIAPTTGWGTPYGAPSVYDVNDLLMFEMPNGLAMLSPAYYQYFADNAQLAFCVRHTGEAAFQVATRDAAGTPSGFFFPEGENTEFMGMATLSKEINVLGDPGQPTHTDGSTTIVLKAGRSSLAQITKEFKENEGVASDFDQGRHLVHLCMIGDEFFTCDYAEVSGTDLILHGPKRGLMDAPQSKHAVDDIVYLFGEGLGWVQKSYPNTGQVEAELRMKTIKGELYGGVQPSVGPITLNKRANRVMLSGIVFNADTNAYNLAPDMQASGSGLDGGYMTVNGRVTSQTPFYGDSETTWVDELTVDSRSQFNTSPGVQLTVVSDPDGAANVIHTSGWETSLTALTVTRNEFIDAAADGTLCRFTLKVRSLVDGVNLEGYFDYPFDCNPTSTLFAGKSYLGGSLANMTASTSYVAPGTGTYRIEVGANLSGAELVEVNINSGGWTTVFAVGTLSGTFAVTAADTIEIRRNGAAIEGAFVLYDAATSGNVLGYGTFKN